MEDDPLAPSTSGQEITWWADRIARVMDDAGSLLDAVASMLDVFALEPVCNAVVGVTTPGRRVLLPGEKDAVDRALLLEAHLVPSSGAGVPLLVAALAHFEHPISRDDARDRLADALPFEALLSGDRPLSERRVLDPFEQADGDAAPKIREARVRAWPLLDLEDDLIIGQLVVPIIRRWLGVMP